MMNEKYYVELDKLNKLLERKNKKTDFYNGIYDYGYEDDYEPGDMDFAEERF